MEVHFACRIRKLLKFRLHESTRAAIIGLLVLMPFPNILHSKPHLVRHHDRWLIALFLGVFAMLASQPVHFAAAEQKSDSNESYETVRTLEGKASYYYGRWIGRKTANGEIYKRTDITAAHKSLPFNTKVRVTNVKNGKSVVVRINNRGPYVRGRILDLSLKAAKAIDMTDAGVVPVEAEILKKKQVAESKDVHSSQLFAFLSRLFEGGFPISDPSESRQEG